MKKHRTWKRNIWKRKIDIKTGQEGPIEDPWGYEEAVIEVNNHRITLHQGLCVWLRIDGKTYELNEGLCYRLFRLITGFENIEAVHRALGNLKRRRFNKCCKKYAKWVRGMPGESFLRCSKCGKFLDFNFNESEIM